MSAHKEGHDEWMIISPQKSSATDWLTAHKDPQHTDMPNAVFMPITCGPRIRRKRELTPTAHRVLAHFQRVPRGQWIDFTITEVAKDLDSNRESVRAAIRLLEEKLRIEVLRSNKPFLKWRGRIAVDGGQP